MIPGEIKTDVGHYQLNVGRTKISITVANSGDRPVQIGSHYHFYEANPALTFDREACKGYRLDVTSGTAVRFEPGQYRQVSLVAYMGKRRIYGFRGEVMAQLETP